MYDRMTTTIKILCSPIAANNQILISILVGGLLCYIGWRMTKAKLHDEELFKQSPPKEDCPICMLPLPELETGRKYKSCCGKIICSGCIHAVKKRDGGVGLCPFCRTPTPTSEEIVEQIKKRADLGDARAMYNMGCHYYHGRYGLPQDYNKALEFWH